MNEPVKMTSVEFREQIAAKCGKCKRWIYCKKHQLLWSRLVVQSPAPREFTDEEKANLRKLNNAFNHFFFGGRAKESKEVQS